MTPLRERMIRDMTLRGFSENTKSSNLNSAIRLAVTTGAAARWSMRW